MALLRNPMTRNIDAARLFGIAILTLVVIGAAILASIAFDWTLASGPSFELTTDPGVDLRF